jgi:hypothetical protein
MNRIFIKMSIAIYMLAFVSGPVTAQTGAVEVAIYETGLKAKKNKHDEYFSDKASVMMADGSSKAISKVRVGENVTTCRNGKMITTQVKQVAVFEKPSSLLTAIYLRPVNGMNHANEPLVPALLIEATPHHMVQTSNGKKKMKQLSKNDILYHYEPETGIVSSWKVGLIQTKGRRVNKAYNLETEEGTYLVANMVMAQ